MSIDHTYQPNIIEPHWNQAWLKQRLGSPRRQANTPAYCIMIPPPNVTGTLHMGHGFVLTLMDGLIRYHRMMGANTLWQVGTDHAGIATQMVVERNLSQDNLTRQSLGREAFLKRVWAWKNTSGGIITDQFKQLGCSVDWSTERFTMDDDYSDSVRHMFVKLYRDDLIYKGQRLVSWDPVFQTAISDLEIINEERNSNLWHIRYPLAEGNDYLLVATTRPETLFGDAAVAVHPDDDRYSHWIGKQVKLPLTDRLIPVIADEAVDKDFGTGCLKITPAHDFNDYEIGKRHQLPSLCIFTPDAKFNDQVPQAFQGLAREEARIETIKQLKAQDLMEAIKPHRHKVPIGDRSGAIIEPMLTEQWFVRCEGLAARALQVVKDGQIKFTPENTVNTYYRWLENIQDWCISRQLWWGHQIPAWTDDTGQCYVGHDEAEVRRFYDLPDHLVLTQDPDVLDTWFSSALWPFATLGWPKKTLDLETFFPTSTLVTGHDIIFFWVARMIMMSLYALDQVPFKEVVITGLIRDENNAKMSKSKGNVIDPMDLIHGISLEDLIAKRTTGLMQPDMAKAIEKATLKQFPNGIQAHGTDALRFTYFALANTGRDIRFDMQRLEGYRNFCNKLWHASRFVLGQCSGDQSIRGLPWHAKPMVDQWILDALETCKEKTHQAFENHRFDHLATVLYDFVWHNYCDWYIEFCKSELLTNSDVAASHRHTLLTVLDEICRLLHPLIPYITESIHQAYQPILQTIAPTHQTLGSNIEQFLPADHDANNSKTKPHTATNDLLAMKSFPPCYPLHRSNDSCSKMAWIMAVITSIRTMRSEMQINPKLQIPVIFTGGTHDYDKHAYEKTKHWLDTLGKCSDHTWADHPDQCPPSACDSIGKLNIHLPLAGIIDVADELKRVEKSIKKTQQSLMGLEKRLSNPNFKKNADPEVFAFTQAQASQLRSELQSGLSHQATLQNMIDSTESS